MHCDLHFTLYARVKKRCGSLQKKKKLQTEKKKKKVCIVDNDDYTPSTAGLFTFD